MKLETALAEKRRLEKDVERLRGELKKAHELLLDLSNQTVQPNQPVICSMFSASCDQEGAASSSLHHGDDRDHGVNHEVKELEELYACLIGIQ